MKLFRKTRYKIRSLKHKFWRWAGMNIAIHKAMDEAKSAIAKDFEGLVGIVDDSTDVAEYGGIEPAAKGSMDDYLRAVNKEVVITLEDSEVLKHHTGGAIKKGYESKRTTTE